MKNKIFYISFLACGMLSLSGCTNVIEQTEETPYYSVMIDGERDYKTDQDENVRQLIELTSAYTELTCNIDYKNQENALEELEYYNEYYRKYNEENNYVEETVETIKYYEQVMELIDYSIKEVQLYELRDEEKAWVECEYITKVTHATDEYFEALGIKKDTKYSRIMKFACIKENGAWKIEGYHITPRVEVE